MLESLAYDLVDHFEWLTLDEPSGVNERVVRQVQEMRAKFRAKCPLTP